MSDVTNASGGAATPEITVPEGEKYTPLMALHLKHTRPWVMFMSIMLIISCSFLVFAGLLMMAMGPFMGSVGSYARVPGFSMLPFTGIFLVLGVFYFAIAGAYVPIIVHLFRFSASIKSLLGTGKTADLESALGHQRAFWKYTGILTIVALGVGFVLIIVAMIVGMASVMDVYRSNSFPGFGD